MHENDRPVLICYDGSDDARRAIAVAGGLVPARRAVVVDVGPPHGGYVGSAPHVVPDNAEVALDRARAAVEEAHRAGFDAAPSSATVPHTARGVAEYAEAVDAALIVMAWEWRGGTAYEVAARAGRAVLAVPPSRG
jgi:hypothetical protein